ncbi:fbd-associated F-box protein at5g60610, partial [Phtheirospermum japonicum]
SASKEDIISKLPDDILVSIITRAPTKSAIRTSILSKRWRSLYKCMSEIHLRCDDLLWPYPSAPHFSQSGLIVYRLERFFSHYSGSKIRSLSLNCCLNKSYMEQCIYSLGKLDVEELILFFCCCWNPRGVSFSCHLFSMIPSLRHCMLASCTLTPNLKSPLCNTTCTTLDLRIATILVGSLDCILSNCLSLHSLCISICNSPSKLCFRGPNLPLKTLIIEQCEGLEEIEIYASNLVTLEYKSRDNLKMINFIFDHVPRLQTLYLAPEGRNLMSYVFGRLPKDLPQLKYLTFDSKGDFDQRLMRMGIETFSKLTRLELKIFVTHRTNLLALGPFLESCPLLQEFHLEAYNLSCEGAKQQSSLVVPHLELKKVEISGFVGTENDVEFALYILKSAVNLEQLLISRCPKYSIGNGKWMRIRRHTKAVPFANPPKKPPPLHKPGSCIDFCVFLPKKILKTQ